MISYFYIVSLAAGGFDLPPLALAALACCIVVAAAVAWYVMRRAHLSTAWTLILLLIIIAALGGAAASAANCAAELTSEFWIRQSLFQRANHIFTLERVRSDVCRTASPAEIAWLNSEIDSEEREFKSPAIQRIIAADPMIQALRLRTEKLRQQRRTANVTIPK